MKLKIALLLICFSSTFTIKAQDEEKPFDLGTVEDNVYTNNFFQFNLPFPKGWYTKIDEDQKLTKKTFDNMEGDNADRTDWIDAARVKTAILIVISKYEQGARVSFNPNMVLLVENISDFPGIRTGEDYLYKAVKMLETTNLKTKVKSKEYERHDFSKVFYSASLLTKMSGMKIKQKLFCTVVDGFCILASCTYETDEELVELYNVISGIEFED